MKRCVVGIRRPGESAAFSCGKGVPTVRFSSMATMAVVLSEGNQAMLRIIQRPKSRTKLAQLPGRQVPKLSRKLRMMKGYGFLELQKNVRETESAALTANCRMLTGRGWSQWRIKEFLRKICSLSHENG